VEADHVYVIPPNTNLTISGGVLHLTARAPNELHLPINEYIARELTKIATHPYLRSTRPAEGEALAEDDGDGFAKVLTLLFKIFGISGSTDRRRSSSTSCAGCSCAGRGS
jgi:hypothetical protein